MLLNSVGQKGSRGNTVMPELHNKMELLRERTGTMLADSFLPNTFWAESVSTACYVLNRVLVTKPHNKTPYELLTETLRTWVITKKEAAKASSTNIFSTVSTPAKASSINLVNTVSMPVSTAIPHEGLYLSDPINPKQDDSEIPPLEDIYQNSSDGIFTTSSYDDEGVVANFTNLESIVNVSHIPTSRIISSHPSALIIGYPTSTFPISHEPKKISEALEDESWVDAMQEEFATIEAIRIFLAFASYMGFIVYQMDVKSAFLYGKIDEEVYVSQPPGFLDPKYLRKSTKLSKLSMGYIKLPEPVCLVLECPHLTWNPTQISDYVGANLDHGNPTTGVLSISWPGTHYLECKKQTIVAYFYYKQNMVAAASYAYEKKLIQVLKIHTDDNVADLLTKAFDVSRGLIRFRESLRRVIDGTKALLLPTLFILWLDTVSTDSAKLVPLGKVCTAIETLKKNTAKALISLLTTITLSTTMAVLDSCPKHNMVAYLEKSEGNAEFHEIIDFLTRSSIHHALTVSPVVSTTFVEQFWTSAKSKMINNVRHITAKVAGKPVSISEASIRSDLLFDDANGIDSLPNQAIFDAIQLMGYEGDLTVLTFNKALFSPQWRFLFHTMNHCLSSKSTSWDQIPTNIATAVICLTSNRKYNFSKLIFDGMLRHLDAKKKFVMYPRFISIFLDKQLANVPVPLDHFPVNTLTSKVFSFMVKKGKHFLGKVTPLFASMLVQPTEDEGAPSERPSKSNRSEPSPRPLPSTIIPDSIPESSGGNLGVSDQAKRKYKHLKAQIKKLKKQAKPGRKLAKGEPSVHRDPLFDEIPEDTLDHMETEDAQLCTDKEKVSTDKEKISTDRPIVSTDGSKVSTDRQIKGTNEQIKSTEDHTEEGSATQATQTPTSTIFGDDETIAKVLLNMSQAKAVSREKEKGVELKDIEETDRPRPTSTRSLLTLKPLPKIDPKDKGKKKIEEEDESESESDGIPEAEKKFKQLESDEEMARKIQEEWEGNFKHSELKTKKFEEIQALYEKIKRSDEDFISIGSAEDERLEYQDEIPEGFDKDWNIVSWKLHGSSGVHTLVTEARLVIHMLVEKKYPLRNKVLLKMLELKLESKEDSTMALELIRFVKKILGDELYFTLASLVKSLASPKIKQFSAGSIENTTKPNLVWIVALKDFACAEEDKKEGIEHQTSTPRTPEQNGVVERRNRTLVEAARTMLSASKLPLSFWAEAVATACYTQNRSIIISTHGKMAYHIINDRKPSIKHLHIFGCICYITRDGENLDKMKEKGDPCVMVGYSTQSKGYRVYNKRTRLIVESIHIKFDEIKEMMSDHNSLDLAPQRQEMSVENVSSGLVPQGQKASDYDNSDPVPPRQNVVPTAEKTDSSQQGLEFLFSPLLEEYYNPAHGHAEDNNNDQAPNASFQEAEFINPFCTRV
ncbi:retrovirus-related pol polyprotein from transposon TNT 1-94 [Tanacetum coccineum]